MVWHGYWRASVMDGLASPTGMTFIKWSIIPPSAVRWLAVSASLLLLLAPPSGYTRLPYETGGMQRPWFYIFSHPVFIPITDPDISCSCSPPLLSVFVSIHPQYTGKLLCTSGTGWPCWWKMWWTRTEREQDFQHLKVFTRDGLHVPGLSIIYCSKQATRFPRDTV